MQQADRDAPELSRRLALRTVIFGGEALNARLLEDRYQRHPEDALRLVNMYGITETTVHVSYLPVSREVAARPAASLIGENIPDLNLYLLDSALRSGQKPLSKTKNVHVKAESALKNDCWD